MTPAELDRAILDAAQAYVAAQRSRPRDPQRVADLRAELEALRAQRTPASE
jgi:hypothetical protein